MKPTPSKGFTVIELTIAIVLGFVVLILVAALIPQGGCITKGTMTQAVSHMKQLHLATQQMTMDNQTTGESPVRWTCSGTDPLSFDQWHKLLVPAYLSENDFKKLLTARSNDGSKVEDAFTVFAVCYSDAPETVFLATKNWQAGAPKLSGPPYGTEGFVLFQKGGDGAALQERQATNTTITGTGGMHNFLPLK